jgi:site-specific recombinase XerD
LSVVLEHTDEGVDERPERDSFRVMTISRAADLWLNELQGRRYSESTIDSYRRLLYKLADRRPFDDVRDITLTDVREFLASQYRRKDGAPKAASTIAGQTTCINMFFAWVRREGHIQRNPTKLNGERVLFRPRAIDPITNDNVVTVSGDEVRRLMREAERYDRWNERLAVNCLAYLGPRRRALARARICDYDQVERTLTFFEKGSKTIAKPVPDPLADMIDRAIYAGVYNDASDYLIPGRAQQRKAGDRDDRVIWKLVREVADRAHVKTHVHALRAAFAVAFLEQHPGEVIALQELMGHKRPETTNVYLRRLDRRKAMESVRDLSWDEVGA